MKFTATDRSGLSTARRSKAELESMLAKRHIKRCGTLYDGREEDALRFVRFHYGNTRAELLLSAKCESLISQDAE